MADDELFATCWTSAGNISPENPDQRSPLDFRQRVELAAHAGFTGMGFLYTDLVEAEKAYGLDSMGHILADNGITQWETEFLGDWWSTGQRRADSDEMRGGMLHFAEKLHARELKVAPDETGEPWDPAHWAEEFAHLARQADDVGTRLGIEFLPWSNVKTVSDGLKLVEDAGHPAGGLVIDVWHTERTGTPPSALAAVPASRIVAVELSDAAATVVGTLQQDTARNRLLCGRGSFDLIGDIRALRSAGWHGPWGIEILSTEYRQLPPEEGLRLAYATGREVVDSAVSQ